jgi:hypothetical protein
MLRVQATITMASFAHYLCIVHGLNYEEEMVKYTAFQTTPVGNTLPDMLAAEISNEASCENRKNIWGCSKFSQLPNLQSNNVGKVGEKFVERILVSSGIEATVDGTKTKELGGGAGDGLVLGKTVEIKTAQLGTSAYTFQHELGENPWNADYMIFLDITPDFAYLTLFKNFTEEFYKSGTKVDPFPTRKVTWRKGTGAFKWDTSPVICNTNVERGITLKIAENTTFQDVSAYVSRIMAV